MWLFPEPRRPNWIVQVLPNFGAECDKDDMWKRSVNWLYIYDHHFLLYLFREPFTTIPDCGPIRESIILLQGISCLIIKRQNYPPTGAHHFLRSASLWRSAAKLNRLSSTETQTPCTPWSLTENTVRLHWVVTPGRGWLANRLRCRRIVIERVSILWHHQAGQELASLATTKMIARRATPELGLVPQGSLMIATPVETWQCMVGTMAIST